MQADDVERAQGAGRDEDGRLPVRPWCGEGDVCVVRGRFGDRVCLCMSEVVRTGDWTIWGEDERTAG